MHSLLKFALFVVLAAAGVSTATLGDSNCSPPKFAHDLKTAYQSWTIHDLTKEFVDNFLCDEKFAVTYIDCYIDEVCGEYTDGFTHIKNQIVENLGADGQGRCELCSSSVNKQVRRLLQFVQKLPRWDEVLEKAVIELQYQ